MIFTKINFPYFAVILLTQKSCFYQDLLYNICFSIKIPKWLECLTYRRIGYITESSWLTHDWLSVWFIVFVLNFDFDICFPTSTRNVAKQSEKMSTWCLQFAPTSQRRKPTNREMRNGETKKKERKGMRWRGDNDN